MKRIRNEQIIKLLLVKGANHNERLHGAMPVESEWDTCLSTSFPSIEIATILLENGADPNPPREWREVMNRETSPLKAAGDTTRLWLTFQDATEPDGHSPHAQLT